MSGGPDPTIPPPRPLEYHAPDIRPSGPATPVAAQGFLGAIAWWAVIFQTHEPTNAVGWVTGASLFVALIGLSGWLRIRHRWRGFIPGLLIAFVLTCLVPIGIVAVVCGPGGSRF